MAGDLQLTRRPFVIAAALLGTASALLIAAGCRESPPPPPPKTEVVDPEPLAAARQAMDRRDYGTAVGLLRDVVARRPTDLEAHYRLGVSASHLDQPDEASGEFEWVVAHGAAGAPEVRISRDWLASRTSPHPPAAHRSVSSDGRQAPRPEMAMVAGRAIGPEGASARLQLSLKGLPGTAVKDEYHVLRTDQRGNFRFTNVVPGDYMLTNAIAGPPAWRLRVSLARGERLVLDLSPANHATVRDDFPEPRP
jgi:hypothetical protein